MVVNNKIKKTAWPVGKFLLACLLLAVILWGVEANQWPATALAKSSPKLAQSQSVKGELSGRKILIAIAPKSFRDEELFVPKRIFEEKGAKVTVASTKKATAEGMLGGTVKVGVAFSEIKAAGYDAIIIAGGTGAKKYLWNDKQLKKIIQEAYNKKKIVAAICLSPVVLARAGCLKGKEATVFPDSTAVKELKAGSAKYVNRDVVIANRVVTARDPESAEKFAQAVVKLLSRK